MGNRCLSTAFSLIMVLSVAALVHGHLDGAPPGHSGAPGEGTCGDVGCHNPSDSVWRAEVDIDMDLQHGDTIGLSVTVFQYASPNPPSEQFGFQLTVLDTSDNAIGTLVLVDSQNTQLVSGDSGRTYVTHTPAGTAGEAGMFYSIWQIKWLRPPDYNAPAQAHAAGLMGNGDTTAAGDLSDDPFGMTDQLEILPCIVQLTGDNNCSGALTSADIIDMIHVVFRNVPRYCKCLAAADVNCSGDVTAGDIIYMVNHVFKGLAPPCNVCDLIRTGIWSCEYWN